MSDSTVFCRIQSSRRPDLFFARQVLPEEHAALDQVEKLPRPDQLGCQSASRRIHRALVPLELSTLAAHFYCPVIGYSLDRVRRSCASSRRETSPPSGESSGL